MRPCSAQRVQLPPLKELEGVAGPLYGSCSSQQFPVVARLSQWESFRTSRAHTPLSPSLDMSSGFDNDPFDQPMLLGTKILKMVDSIERPTTMPVPIAAEKSAGGWFDPSRWLFKLVFQKFGDKNIEELIKLMFYRESRPRYGEDHTSTRARKTAEQPGADTSDARYNCSKQSSSDAHKQQEQDRRRRHRTLQYETDECTGTYVCEAAEQMLPLIKETINQMPREDFAVQETDRKVKRLGKDEQLTAAALLPHISSILIFKLYDALEELRSRFQQNKVELQRQREIRINIQFQLSQLERENERLKAKISYLDLERQPTCRKRTTAGLEAKSDYESDQRSRATKRHRFEPMPYAGDRLNGCQPPLSPQSEGDEFAATSFKTSSSLI